MAITIEQHIKKLKSQLELIEKENKPLFMASTEGARLIAKRVFVDGRNSQNQPIALRKRKDGTPPTQYSRKPFYMNPKESPKKFKTMGKTGETKFKNGKPHKTRYFEGGYADFRNTIGRDMIRINLKLTGDLASDFVNNRVAAASKTIGRVRPIKVSVDEYVLNLRPTNWKKMEGLEARSSSPIFEHTEQELEQINKVAKFELFKILNK